MKEFNDLLKEIGLTRKEFALLIGITYKSIGVMLVEGKPMPKWAKSALIVYKKTKLNNKQMDYRDFKISAAYHGYTYFHNNWDIDFKVGGTADTIEEAKEYINDYYDSL